MESWTWGLGTPGGDFELKKEKEQVREQVLGAWAPRQKRAVQHAEDEPAVATEAREANTA